VVFQSFFFALLLFYSTSIALWVISFLLFRFVVLNLVYNNAIYAGKARVGFFVDVG